MLNHDSAPIYSISPTFWRTACGDASNKTENQSEVSLFEVLGWIFAFFPQKTYTSANKMLNNH